jgi:hypothetical protein
MDKQIEIKRGEGVMVDLLNQEMNELQAHQKQIEEMAKVLDGDCGECYTCKYFEHKGTNCTYLLGAEYLYNAGYRKIPEGVVVLKKEEYESVKDSVDLLREYESVSNSLIKSNELCRKLIDDKKELKRQLEQTRKETAEKFAERLKSHPIAKTWFLYNADGKINVVIDEILKEITEGKI